MEPDCGIGGRFVMNRLFLNSDASTLKKLLFASPMFKGGDTPSIPYVADGLVFWLDGINKGNDNTKWVDVAGNKEIALTNCTFTENAVDFSASGAYGLLDGVSTGVLPADGTIEACVSGILPSFASCLLRGENTAIRFYHAGASHRIEMNGSSSATSWDGIPVSGFTSVTASMNEARAFFNGKALTPTTGRTWMSSISTPCIIIGGAGGISNPASTGQFNGFLHAIRIYNRKLSEVEIMQNQIADNARFGLGLQISA